MGDTRKGQKPVPPAEPCQVFRSVMEDFGENQSKIDHICLCRPISVYQSSVFCIGISVLISNVIYDERFHLTTIRIIVINTCLCAAPMSASVWPVLCEPIMSGFVTHIGDYIVQLRHREYHYILHYRSMCLSRPYILRG